MSLEALLAAAATGDAGAQQRVRVAANRVLDAGDAAATNDCLDAIAMSAANGSRPALEVLLDLVRHRRLAQPAIRRFLVGAADIDDAEQTTLTAVALRIDRFSARSRFTTWLHSVAANEAKMLIRREASRPDPIDPHADPGHLVRISSMISDRAVIDEAVAALPDEFRIPLLLREVDGLSYDQIARRLDLPIGTVRSRLARARRTVADGAADALS